MTITKFSRRFLLKAGLAFGACIFMGINFSTRAVAGIMQLKSYMQDRIDGVYKADRTFAARSPLDNGQVRTLYENYLGEPGGHVSHKYLHMHFYDRSKALRKLCAEGKTANAGAVAFDGDTYPYEWFPEAERRHGIIPRNQRKAKISESAGK
jgi:hypothetical protein